MGYMKSRVSEMLSIVDKVEIKKIKTKLLNFRINEDIYESFKNVCEARNVSMTDVLKQYIIDIVDKS